MEPLILASVTLEDSGVVTSAASMGKAVDDLGEKVNSAGRSSRSAGTEMERLGEHLTSVTGAARILGHTIGVTALAIGTVGLAKSVIEGSEAFKEFSASMHEFTDTALRGVDVAQSLDKQFADLAKAGGIRDTVAEIRLKNDEARESLKRLQDQGNPSNWRLALEGIKDFAHFSDAVANYIGAVHDRMAEVQPEVERAKAASTFIGPVAPDYIGTKAFEESARLVAEELKREQELEAFRERAARANFERNRAMFAGLGGADPFKAAGLISPERIDLERQKLLLMRQSFAAAFDSTGLVMYRDALKGVDDQLNTLSDTGASAAGRFETLANSLAKLAPRLGDAAAGFAEGNLSAKKFIKEAMADLSRFAFTRSLTYLAASLGATTGIGAVIEGGTPHQLRMAALKWAAVGAATGIGSRAFGGGESGSGGGGGGATTGRISASTERGTQQRVTNLQVFVDGNVVGNEAWLRGALVEMQRQISDGTNGGGFSA